MKKDILIQVLIYFALFSLIVLSILDAPMIPQDVFGVILITWVFYETLRQKVEIVKLHDEIKLIKEVVSNKWQGTNFRSQSK